MRARDETSEPRERLEKPTSWHLIQHKISGMGIALVMGCFAFVA